MEVTSTFTPHKLLLLTAALLLSAVALAASPRQCAPCGTTDVPYPLSTGPTCGDQDYKVLCNNGALIFPTSNNTYPITSIKPQSQRLVIQPSSFLPNTCVTEDISTTGVQLNQTAPFNITGDNTIMYLNCTPSLLGSPLNCSSSSLCHVYINATREAAACQSAPICCTFQAGGGTTAYMIRVRSAGCRAYRSFVDLDPTEPVTRWGQPGVMIQWRLPQEPVCRTQADCAVDGGNSTCRVDPISVGSSRCFCNSPLRWDGVNGVCAEVNTCEDPAGCNSSHKTALIAGNKLNRAIPAKKGEKGSKQAKKGRNRRKGGHTAVQQGTHGRASKPETTHGWHGQTHGRASDRAPHARVAVRLPPARGLGLFMRDFARLQGLSSSPSSCTSSRLV